MKILLINHYAGSSDMGMEYRPYYLAKEWIKNGHEVTILAGSYSHVRTNQPLVNRNFQVEMKEGIRYIWIKTPAYKGNGISRFISMLSFVFKILIRTRTISKKYKPDVVIASSTYPLDNYAAGLIAGKNKAQHIYEVHDLWPLSPVELGGMSKNHPFIMMMQAAENYSYKKAHKVISMLPKTLDHMVQHGLQPDKWHYIPNGIIAGELKNQVQLPIAVESHLTGLKQRGYYIIAYTGSIGLANALDNFLDAAKLMLNQNLAFIIVGDGPEKERLMNKAKIENLDDVFFIDAILKNSIAHFLKLCDILYIGLQHKPLFRFGISPNKMLDYMMAAKPIIQAIDAGNNMVIDAQCGISVEPEKPEELVKAIKQILNMPIEKREEMGENGKKYVIENHNYSILAKQMLEIFQIN